MQIKMMLTKHCKVDNYKVPNTRNIQLFKNTKCNIKNNHNKAKKFCQLLTKHLKAFAMQQKRNVNV